MKKCMRIWSVVLMIAMLLTVFGGCFRRPTPPVPHSITVAADIENGTVTVDKTSATEGETVTVTATPEENYVLVGITANGIPVENGAFTMGNEDVVVSASFVLNSDRFETNAGVEGGTAIKAPSMGGNDANAQIFTVFGETGIEFTAYVTDSAISDKDGAAILLSKKLPTINQLLPNGQTVKLEAYADGTTGIYKTDAEGKLVADALAGSAISLKLWTKDGQVAEGYIVRAAVSYEALGVTKDTAKGNVTICPVIYNAYGSVNAKATALNGANEKAQNTFPVLSDDNTYLDNPFKAPSASLGSDGGILAGDTWDLSKDYYKEDTENYPNRVVTLTGHDGADNNLVFVGVSAPEMYAEATIRVTGVANPNDQWPKFGLMLFNGGGQSGLFYYVDAAMNSGSGNTTANIVGTALGYNKGSGTWSNNWAMLKNGVFDLNTLTVKLQMVFQNGWAHLYANDQFIESIFVGKYNENMHFGFKSFGLELEVTDYMASTDAEADGWAHLKKAEADAKKVDILFAGDSYMDFWKSRYQSVHMADYTTSFANEGIGGTMVPLWIDKIGEMAQLYDPANIAFHIGVNDIDSNAGVETTVANLKTMFELYHEVFPDAKIYWNSLIPNTMFAGRVPEYYQVNEQVKAYAEGKDWLVYINQTPFFEKEAGVADPIFFDDGLHLSADIGYPLWVKNMLTAMGYTYEEGATMGSENGFIHSGGWTYEGGTATVLVGNEMVTYFKGASGETVYVESMVTIGNLLNNDGYPKFGYVLHGAEKSLWGLVDSYGYPGQKNTTCAFVVRENVQNGDWVQREGWNWSKWLGGTSLEGSYSDGNYIKMAVAKLGNDVYLTVNDKIVASTTIEGEVTVGFQVFNLETTVKDAVVIKDETTIKEKLGLVEPTSAVVDGKADDAIWTDEVLGNTIALGHKGDGRYFEANAVKAPEGVYFLLTTYSHENTRVLSGNWWENANIEMRLGNDLGTQYWVYYAGPGFGDMVGSTGIAAVASSGGVQLENGLWKATAEFLIPYNCFAGYDENSAELPVYFWGWVFDEGWKDAMNVGAWPLLSVSEHGLRFQNNITVEGNNSAVTVTPSVNNAYAGETVTLDVQTTATVESITVKTASGAAVEVTENSFVMPNEAVIVTVKLQGISVSTHGENADISCEAGVVVPGQTVTFTVTARESYKLIGVKVNGQNLELTADGSYSYVVAAGDTGVAIEAITDYDTEGYTIDGIMDEGENYGAPISFRVEGNRLVSVYAVKGANGVYFYVSAYTDTVVNDNAAEWWMNHNFEFQFNMSGQRYVNSRNESRDVTKSVWTSTQVTEGEFSGKWQHVTEIFVHRSSVPGFDGDVQLNFAFKAPYEAARYEGLSSNTWDRSDWWTPSVGTLDGVGIYDFGATGVSPWLKIRANGLVNTRPAPQNGVIDGELNEYAGKLDLYRGNENAYFHIMGYEADDGVYLAFEIWQKNRAEATAEWHLNDNVEVQINGVPCGISLFDNFAVPTGSINSWAMKRVESDKEGYAHKTVVEMFVKMNNVTKHSFVYIGCNGNGFAGWQPLCWDGNLAWTSADGITDAWGAAADDGVTVDGKGDEAIYTGKDYVTFTPNDATVTMTGAKLEHGASFLLTVNHVRPVTDNLQGAEDWWSYLNFELYLGEGTPQAKASVWNNYSWWCASAYTTTDNGDGTYTTVMEIYIPYGLACGKDTNADFLLGLGTVIDTGYAWCAEWATGVWLTDTGVVKK